MIKEERAIQILEQRECCRECVVSNCTCAECDEAFDMAIKVLKQGYVFDKIRAEIEPTRKMYLEMNDIDWLNGCDYVLSIIDKYKVESGVTEQNIGSSSDIDGTFIISAEEIESEE